MIAFLIRGVLLAILAGAASFAVALEQATPPLLADADWLAGHMGREDLVVVDVRSARQYAEGHIDGAINLPVDETFGRGTRSDLLAPVITVRELLGRAGLHAAQHVVLYDDCMFDNAPRLFWVLEAFGHMRVSILDGGLAAWRAAGGAISTEPTRLPETDFVVQPQSRRIATQHTALLATLDPNTVLIDTRTPAEYGGYVGGAKRKGHIPTAINIPWNQQYHGRPGEVRLRPSVELEKLYRDIDPADQKVIVYCTRGKQSALSYFVLRKLGYDVAAYDGSWFEWGNDPRLPIEGKRP